MQIMFYSCDPFRADRLARCAFCPCTQEGAVLRPPAARAAAGAFA